MKGIKVSAPGEPEPTASGAAIDQWTCNGGTNQTWRYVSPTTP